MVEFTRESRLPESRSDLIHLTLEPPGLGGFGAHASDGLIGKVVAPLMR
jgi:hypothetical protein